MVVALHALWMMSSFQSLLSQFDRFHHGTSLVAGFFVLMLWIGVCHDPGAGLNKRLMFLDDDGSDVDAHVHVTGIAEIADGAGIGTPSSRLQLINDFHGADFRGSRYRAGGKTGAQDIIGGLRWVQLACDI